MASQAFKVLYTKQLTRKLKAYNDGYLIRDGPRARLFDDVGIELACCRWPPSLQLDASSEGIACFEGFLVDCDEELTSPAEVARLRPGLIAPTQPSVCSTSAAAGGPSPEQQMVAPGGLPTGVRGKFKPPRMAVPPPRSAPDPQQEEPAHSWHATRNAQASLLGKRWQADQEAPAAVAACQQAPPVRRSDEDIMALLLPPEGRAAHSVTLPVAAKRICVDDTDEKRGGGMASSVPPRAYLLPPEPTVARARGPSVPVPAARLGGHAGGNTVQHQPQTLQTWAALSMPSGDGTSFVRRATISDGFSGAEPYQQQLVTALSEELRLRLAEVAHRIRSAKQQHFPGIDDLEKASPHDYERIMWQRAGLVVCRATLQPVRHKAAAALASRHRRGDTASGQAHGGQSPDGDRQPGATAFLMLQGSREKSSAYRKGDLWILSSAPFFAVPSEGIYDRARLPWVAVAQSLWHGPNHEGRMEVEFISRNNPPQRDGAQQVYALHGPDASLELSMMRALMQLSEDALPVLPALLQVPPARTQQPPPAEQLQSVAASACLEPQNPPAVGEGQPIGDSRRPEGLEDGASHPRSAELAAATRASVKADGLNAAQAVALRSAAAWLEPYAEATSPVVLVHGPFGSGKSTLLVSMVRFLRRQLQQVPADSPLRGARILVAAHTNTAVDRIMVGLLETGYKDMLRVGSLKRMDRAVLPFSLHCCESSKSTAVDELKEMLKAASSAAEAAIIEKELQSAIAGAEKKRRQRLKSVPVVGATCCAMLLPVLDKVRFDIVILDEATQATEPLSLVALIRARAKHVVIAGDPCQLGPILAFPSFVSPEGTAGSGMAGSGMSSGTEAASAPHGLARPMFQRLQALGHTPVLLRHQYRCHPALSCIPNAVFYGGRLLDGCSEEQRAGLVAGLPPLTFVNVNGHRAQDGGHSSSNVAEAQAVGRLVRQLAATGVKASAIGVICFFTAQVKAVQNQLGFSTAEGHRAESEARPEGATASGFNPQVATVDSFQGQEKEIIILTTVVTGGSVAFAGDPARLNVALTRARQHLVVVGSADALQSAGPAFCRILEACRRAPGAFWPYGQVLINMRRAEGEENQAPGADTGNCPPAAL